MRLLLISLISIIFIFPASAQSLIKGSVTDDRSAPISFASVTLHQVSDSSAVKSTLSGEDGRFSFNNIFRGNYYISISAVGYLKNSSAVFSFNAAPVLIPNLTLKKDNRQLNEVVIKAKKKFIEQHADRLVINVSKSSLSSGVSAAEVLKRVPGIRVTNERVTLTGKNKLVITVDSRLSPYQDMNALLRSIPSSTIDKIEVITSPPANLDAEGDAIINIVLKRKSAAGTGGSVTLGSGGGLYHFPEVNRSKATTFQYNPAITLYHHQANLTLNSSYSFTSKQQFEVNLFERYHDGNVYDQRNFNPITYQTHNYQLSADLKTDSLNVLSIAMNGSNRQGEGQYHNNSVESQALTGKIIDGLTSLNQQHNRVNNKELNVTWLHYFNRKGEQLQISSTAAWYGITTSSQSAVQPNMAPAYLNKQQLYNPLNFQTATADYVLPLGSFGLQAGMKSSFANIHNRLQFDINNAPDPIKSNRFIYAENINAAYFNSTIKLKKWDLKAGLRAEQTYATGKNESAVLLHRNYLQFFPSLFINKSLDSAWAVSGQYSRRIGRPSFQQQNPFEVYLDPQTYTKGNPLLRPQITNSSKISLTNEGQPVLQVGYDRTSNVIVDYAPQQREVKDPNGKARLISFSVADNLATSENYSAQLNFPLKAGQWLDGYGGVMPAWQRYHAYYQGGFFDAAKLSFTFYTQVDLKITPTWSGQLSAYYATPSQYEFIRAGRNSSVDLGLSKSIWQNKGKLSINLFDLFYMDKTRGSILYQDIDVRLKQYTDTRSLIISFSYNFGITKHQRDADRDTGAEEERKRVKTN